MMNVFPHPQADILVCTVVGKAKHLKDGGILGDVFWKAAGDDLNNVSRSL